MHRLLDHTAPFAWDGRADDADDANGDADDANGDAAIEQMLGELEQKVHGQEVA